MDNNQKLNICLWFDTHAGEAMDFYTSIFTDSKKGTVTHYGPNMPMPEGTVLTATWEMNGMRFMGLNGGPIFKFSEAVSIVVNCKTQEEIDHYWNNLLKDGGQESQCGWLKDKFGFSWQIVPVQMEQLMNKGDGAATGRMMQAMMKMVKLDIATLEAAYNGK